MHITGEKRVGAEMSRSIDGMDIKVLQLTVISVFEEILKNLEESQKVPKKEFKGQRKWLVERTSKIYICLACWGWEGGGRKRLRSVSAGSELPSLKVLEWGFSNYQRKTKQQPERKADTDKLI